MPKFGGPGKQRQKCVLRRCTAMALAQPRPKYVKKGRRRRRFTLRLRIDAAAEEAFLIAPPAAGKGAKKKKKLKVRPY